jgi:hypothetical protein
VTAETAGASTSKLDRDYFKIGWPSPTLEFLAGRREDPLTPIQYREIAPEETKVAAEVAGESVLGPASTQNKGRKWIRELQEQRRWIRQWEEALKTACVASEEGVDRFDILTKKLRGSESGASVAR